MVEEPKKEEAKRTKVKVAKAKKYEELPEIPDYERPVLEKYEESAFEPTAPAGRTKLSPLQKPEVGVQSKIEKPAEPENNGLPKVGSMCFPFAKCTSNPDNIHVAVCRVGERKRKRFCE